jgi:thymidylate kinase
MIIELFGPPAAGKTTLANALAAALRLNGLEVRLMASARPAERAAATDTGDAAPGRRSFSVAASLRRAAKLTGAMPAFISGDLQDDIGAKLLALLPPRKLLWRVRLKRYLSQLRQSWDEGRADAGITIIDQGYLSALCSLAVRTHSPDAESLARGLEFIPRADLLVCLDAPSDHLRERLAKRLGRQSAVERLFEQDADMNRRQVEMVRKIAGALRERGWPAANVNCADHSGLESAVRKIAQEIAAQREAA